MSKKCNCVYSRLWRHGNKSLPVNIFILLNTVNICLIPEHLFNSLEKNQESMCIVPYVYVWPLTVSVLWASKPRWATVLVVVSQRAALIFSCDPESQNNLAALQRCYLLKFQTKPHRPANHQLFTIMLAQLKTCPNFSFVKRGQRQENHHLNLKLKATFLTHYCIYSES